jgi:quercetin dioxygenase-like cupin family protein
MRHLPIAIAVTAALAWGATSVAAAAEEAVVADPKHYSAEFENDGVRVVRIHYGPRERSVMHSHARDGLLVYLTDHRVRFTYPDGTSEEVTAKAGRTAWVKAGTHLPENLEAKPLELLYVEIK